MDSSYCQHPEAMKVSWAGLSEDAVSRARLCFHGNDSEPARDELFEPRKPDVETCKHDYSSDGTFSGGCVNMVCRHCGDEYERDVS